ncbi:tRNA (N6-threonylcarbamoyladenosine(37)-N6)-methyltransferase TrmO [Thalassotalea aquiviva]|uniref:tRNA (N6-threonylcarbamoyladenosine(37)-N6)-methyltransferase TrmO n=1 Tax=Thalassotalea aquiviva TaxID=3242415 RepID=UPI00352B0415
MTSTTSSPYQFEPIGRVHSPYKEKFAIPRQPGLVSAAQGKIEILCQGNAKDLFRDIEQHSHIWVLFVFHATAEQGWKPLVKAPRLGGNKKTGVFATRSTFRPNPIGMSVVKHHGISQESGRFFLNISGHDLLDQTPVIDIKPYIPYSDQRSDAFSQMAPAPEQHHLQVNFTSKAQLQLQSLGEQYPKLSTFIEQVLAQDPRPAYKKQQQDKQIYGMSLYDLNIRWQINAHCCDVIDIEKQLATSEDT